MNNTAKMKYDCGCEYQIGRDWDDYWTISSCHLCEEHSSEYHAQIIGQTP